MLKQRIITALVGIALLMAAAGSSGIVADSLGVSVTSQVYACHTGGSTGGGC